MRLMNCLRFAAVSVCIMIAGMVAKPASAQSAQLAATPPMGWNSWNHFATRVTMRMCATTADILVSSGMRDAGYIYVNIDDTWEGERDAQGVIHTNSKFPDMKALADYVHSKGLKIGIYSGPGPKTCARIRWQLSARGAGREDVGATGASTTSSTTCAAWVGSSIRKPTAIPRSAPSSTRLSTKKCTRRCWRRDGRSSSASASTDGTTFGSGAPRSAAISGARPATSATTYTRMIGDWVYAVQSRAVCRARPLERSGHARGRQRRHDHDEYRTHMRLWVILAAPLLAGNDLSKMTPETKAILTNRDVIAIDQDKLGKQGYRVSAEGATEIWEKPLSDSAKAVGLFNRGESAAPSLSISSQWDLAMAQSCTTSGPAKMSWRAAGATQCRCQCTERCC